MNAAFKAGSTARFYALTTSPITRRKAKNDDRNQEQGDEGRLLQGLGDYGPDIWPIGAHKRSDGPFAGKISGEKPEKGPLNDQMSHLHINQG